MTGILDPREVVVTLASIRAMTNLETARANTLAGVRQSDAARLPGIATDPDAPPADVELLFTWLYACAYQLERRQDPTVTWETAQTWRVTFDVDAGRDELAEAEAVASVDAAVMTGLPPSVAGSLTVAQMDEYRAIADERERQLKARRRRRSG